MLHSLIALPPEITLNLYHHKVTETRTRHVNVLHVYNPHPVSTGDPGEAEEDCRHMLISDSTKQSRACAPDRHISPADIGRKRQKIGVTMGSGNNGRYGPCTPSEEMFSGCAMRLSRRVFSARSSDRGPPAESWQHTPMPSRFTSV